MLSFLGSILGVGLKWVLSYFAPSKDEKLGQLEVIDNEHIHAFKDIKKAQAARDAVRLGGTIGMRDDPEDRDNR